MTDCQMMCSAGNQLLVRESAIGQRIGYWSVSHPCSPCVDRYHENELLCGEYMGYYRVLKSLELTD